ncbi:MAG TPA: HD domain-containing protein, partial [Methylomirabilota bacterium]|nr:HD domain-containing protein [Methylomirabilota bacterium]
MLDRGAAWSILTEFTKSDSLRKHARAVEASMRAYAIRYGEDPEAWGVAGMLHDFDYEMHPAAPRHPMKGAEILTARGVAPPVIYAILAHADYSGMPRVSRLDRALYACDELSGFVHACALVRPGK